MRSFFKTYGVSPEGLVLCLDQSDPRSYGDLTNWYDLSPYANHGVQATASDQPAIGGVVGLAGMTRIFDGVDDDIALGINKFIITNMTLSAWINPAVDLISQSDYVAFIDKQLSWSLTTWAAGEIIIQTYYGDGTGWIRATSVTTPVANTWYLITGVIDGTNAMIYINGVEESRTSLPDTVYNKSGSNTIIGNDRDAAPRFFNGLISQAHIWNRALNSGEIQALYNATRRKHGK